MLKDLHLDLIMSVCSHLELADILSLVSVCSSLRNKAANSKSFWISALTRTAKERNLACPVGGELDLSEFPLEDLRHVARRTSKLKRNWDAERPRLTRSIRVLQYSESVTPAHILCAISGTTLVLLSQRGENIILCDSEGRGSLSTVELSFPIVHHAHFDAYGRHLMAILTVGKGNRSSLMVFCIDYGVGKIPSIRELFTTSPPYTDSLALFISMNIIGLVDRSFDGKLCLRIVNYVHDICLDVALPIDAAPDPFVFCSVVDTALFIILVSEAGTNNETHKVFRCPVDGLAAGQVDSDWGFLGMEAHTRIRQVARCLVPFPPEASGGWAHRFMHTIEAKVSSRGFHIFHNVALNEYALTTYASFWPISTGRTHRSNTDTDTNDETRSIGSSDAVTAQAALGGMVGEPGIDRISAPLVASGNCGIYSAAIVEDMATVKFHLCLIHRDVTVDPPMIHVHTLAIPNFIDLSQICSIAVDERLGAIYLSHWKGYLFSLPYA